MSRNQRLVWSSIGGVLLLGILVTVLILALTGSDKEEAAKDDPLADAQVVHFQAPTDVGPDPFTPPADVEGDTMVRVGAGAGGGAGGGTATPTPTGAPGATPTPEIGSGPFGGTGSNLVCDRELLISSLRARPDRMREWARVRGIPQDFDSVAAYIRSLRPVTLTTDVRVTNHTFIDGRAIPIQSILQAGTAVLVDEKGEYVARCRCGNPLLPPIYIPEAKCISCPPAYVPPPPCRVCWQPYPSPPPVRFAGRPRRPRPPRRPPVVTATTVTTPTPSTPRPPPAQEQPYARWVPDTVERLQRTEMQTGGWLPGATLLITTINPVGNLDTPPRTVQADASGSFRLTGQAASSDPVRHPAGAYVTTVQNQATGAQAQATITVVESGAPPATEPPAATANPEQDWSGTWATAGGPGDENAAGGGRLTLEQGGAQEFTPVSGSYSGPDGSGSVEGNLQVAGGGIVFKGTWTSNSGDSGGFQLHMTDDGGGFTGTFFRNGFPDASEWFGSRS